MKQLLRYTSILLRTALLFGALALTNIPTHAQTAEQWAKMPDAFETMNPASIIGDGNYYYIQFYTASHDQCSYLTDCGVNEIARSKDFLPYANNRLWTLESAGETNQFKLKNKAGHYLYLETGGSARVRCVNNSGSASILKLTQLGDGYDISAANNDAYPMARNGNTEWQELICNFTRRGSRDDWTRLRFAKLKSTAAFIIYYRGEHTDGNDNSSADASTTRHYLTYSGTGNENPARDGYFRDSEVSSRRSIIPSDKPLCTLPTLAAYHQDGLWTLEETGNDGQFYIKKYGSTDEYLNLSYVQGGDGFRTGVLGVKDNLNGNYTLVDRDANRYTLIQNVKYNETSLASNMFYNWTGYGANPTQGGQANVEFNTNHWITAEEIANGFTVVGTGSVDHQIYANLTNYSKMVIKGDQNMQLRVLMNRQESNSGYYVERDVTIGSDGTAVVDLTGCTVGQGTVKMTYTNADAPDTPAGDVNEAKCGYNKISSNGDVNLAMPSYGRNFLAYLQVDASVINGTIKKVTLTGDFQQITDRALEYGVGYSNVEWSSTMTWNTASRAITRLGGTQTVGTSTEDKTLSFDITGAFTDSKVKTILLYCLKFGGGYIKNPKVYVEYEPNDASTRYVHLNAIKTGWSSPTGTITGIGLMSENTGDTHYLHHAKGDGWQLMEWTGTDNDYFYAGFYPVEVPVPNKDDYFQVLLQLKTNTGLMVNYDGGAIGYSEDPATRKLFQLEQVDNYLQFRLKTPTGQYLRPYPVPGGVTDPNDPTDADIITNLQLVEEKFNIKWFYVDPTTVPKEIPVKKGDNDLYMVTHKMSYLKQYAQAGLDKQGLATNAQSDWWNYDNGTQKTNHFEITHYVKKGNTITVEFPTVLNRNNDHIYFQRFYNYDEDDANMDLDNLKAHVSLDTRDDGDVQYFLYKNGLVTGQKLDWTYNDGTDIPDGGMARNALRRFNFTNSDGNAFTVAADVSRYSDMRYWKPTEHLNGDLEEPSLTMRYIYKMKDAKEMAADLSTYTEISGVSYPDKVWKEVFTGDENAFLSDNNWKESKVFHFPAKPVAYEEAKLVGYRGEFIGLKHVFSDYWVFDGNGTGDDNLVSAVNSASEGKIEVRIYDPNDTGIRLGGWNPTVTNLKSTNDNGDQDKYEGFYFYDKVAPNVKTSYGDSRFVVFRYPEGGVADEKTGVDNRAYIHVYLNNNGTRYQLAQFTLIFDKGSETIPYTKVNASTSSYAKGSDRDPINLVKKAGKPIAKITFDYPSGETYHYPINSVTRHDGGDQTVDQDGVLHYYVEEGGVWVEKTRPGTINNSSPVPLVFDNTNYAFDGDGCNWGSYAIVAQKGTIWGNGKQVNPANDNTYGYGVEGNAYLQADADMQKGLLYIDASEQPGDICSTTFQGEFCASDKLICSGWISGSNTVGGERCPGGVTLTVTGEDSNGDTKTIYRFCPGQCYELDNGGVGIDGAGFIEVDDPDNPGQKKIVKAGDHVIWQQFYFTFSTDKKYERYWLEVNNNCVSSNGGDFMLDNIEVYAYVPEVDPEMNTPLCVKKDGTTEMRLLKLKVDYNKLKSSANISSGTTYLGFVFLEKDVFLKTLKQEKSLSYSLKELAKKIADGTYTIAGNDAGYRKAFDAALLRKDKDTKTIWKSDNSGVNKGSGILYFKWDTNFESELMPQYSFYKAVNKTSATYRYTDSEGEPFLIMNGNFPELPWKTNTDYYIVPSNVGIDSFDDVYSNFNICSDCSKASVFQLDPPYQLLSMESSEVTEDLVVCEGKIPTVLTNLKGYDMNGKLIPMTGLNFDWWLGDKANGVVATLENYHTLQKVIGGETVKLDVALSTLRAYYKDVTNLDGIIKNLTKTPNLTAAMVTYLQELIDKGQLVLHQKSISIPAKKTSDEDPYFYLVACPIHDEIFDQALNPAANQYVSYFCDEPQGVRMKIGDKAPTLKCGFVPGENGFTSYDYSTVNDAVLSIRLAKKAQFMTVQHGEANESPVEPSTSNAETIHYLWLPIRNAETETASGVIRKSADYDVYLASTNDPTWDKNIYTAMTQTVPSLPVVGKIVQLTAINTKGNINLADQNNTNRLCIYFTSNFEVREGYSYTLSLPFQEVGDVNSCDGTMLINMKIVPDYEVWTGAAGNTDWNNDQNWRRADYDELYAGNGSTLNATDGTLQKYQTNAWNYRTPKDRLFRKGFAPLYCTHVLMMSDEWGDAPVLYDALDTQSGKSALSASPFPNLRDEDNWDSNGAEATATSILKFDMQARRWELWEETYGTALTAADNKGRTGDLVAEMYQINTCDEIAFQPATELRNAHLLNYNNAWVEYQLDMGRWYLLGSPLQGTIAGEWYAPTGDAQQKTTYYENVTFGKGYDRYSPAIFQRSWDKAKAVLYEVDSEYSTSDDSQTEDLGHAWDGHWDNGTWKDPTGNAEGSGADDYLDRLGYKPMSGNKANVAIKGVWSNTYNDATVDYTKGGFSVMVLNNLKPSGNGNTNPAIIRLPKEDIMYDYYRISETGAADGGTDTDLIGVQNNLSRAKNRGRLKTDKLLPESTYKTESAASRYGDTRTYTRVPIKEADLTTMIDRIRNHQETVSAGISENMKFYLVENPFPCGLDMAKFFAANSVNFTQEEIDTATSPDDPAYGKTTDDVKEGLEKKYWLLTETGQHLVQYAKENNEWIAQSGNSFTTANAVVAPGQGFFVEAVNRSANLDIVFNKNMQAQTRFGKKDGGTPVTIEVGRSQVMVDQTVLVDMDGDGTAETEQTIQVPKIENDVPVTAPIEEDVTVYKYTQDPDKQKYELKARTRSDKKDSLLGLVITAQRGNDQSSALVMQREGASNDFRPEEDTEVFINSDLEYVPTVYTLCGRLATTINSIHDFHCLPLGVESSSDAPCTLTFKGVEMLGDSIAFYDALEQKLTPLESGMQFSVSGQTQNRYYLIRSLDQKEAAEETHIQIFTKGLVATVIASTAEPITSVRCFDTAGRLVYSASPQTAEYSFNLPAAGIYIIEAQTDADHKTKKVMTK